MLKVEYPCCEIFSSCQNSNKPIITATQVKKHVHDIRLQRQKQLETNINECHRLHIIHKQIYQHQLDSYSREKPVSHKPIINESPVQTKTLTIPRIEHASAIYRQAIPTFEIKTNHESENALPIVKELREFISKSPCAISNDHTQNKRSLLPIKHDRQRCLSVSSVSSVDKRANRVYEKWPDYNQISELVGYRINPPSLKLITSTSISSRPLQTKRTSSTSKQKKSSSRTLRKPAKSVLIPPVIIDEPPCVKPIDFNPKPIIEIQPKLPNLLCPSSLAYSQRIRTRQWLMKQNFSSNTIRTSPLL